MIINNNDSNDNNQTATKCESINLTITIKLNIENDRLLQKINATAIKVNRSFCLRSAGRLTCFNVLTAVLLSTRLYQFNSMMWRPKVDTIVETPILWCWFFPLHQFKLTPDARTSVINHVQQAVDVSVRTLYTLATPITKHSILPVISKIPANKSELLSGDCTSKPVEGMGDWL